MSKKLRKSAVVVCWLASRSVAGIPEPDAVLHGNAYVDGFPVLQQDSVLIVARLETGQEVGRFDFADCNGDGVRDVCELSCTRPGCSGVVGCGTARDTLPAVCSPGSSNAGAHCDADSDCTGGTCNRGDGLLDDCPGDLYVLKNRCESTPDGLTASGQCASGPNVGRPCSSDADCGKACSAASSNSGATCNTDANCPGGTCDLRGCPLPAAAVLNPANPTVVRILLKTTGSPERFVRNLLVSDRGKIRQLALSILNLHALDDYVNCQRGPEVNTPSGTCAVEFFSAADYDEDGDVDLGDYAFIQAHFVPQ